MRSVVLTVSVCLLVHSFWRVIRVDPGFQPQSLLRVYLRTNYYSEKGRAFLHVVAPDGDAAAAAIRECLAREGFHLERLERITPSLEDVFVSLIEARDRAEQPQEEVQR